MSAREANFWRRLAAGLWSPNAVLMRMENAVAVGVPDVYYCFNGVAGWIELKAPEAPRNESSLLFGSSHKLSLQQRNWLDANRAAGGRGWIAIETANEILLIDARLAGVVNALSLKEARRSATVVVQRPCQREGWSMIKFALIHGDRSTTPETHPLRVLKGLAKESVGACNACTDRAHTMVTEIRMRSSHIRLCSACLEKMKAQL